MSEECLKCGLSDGRHAGYHEDAELPVKRGDRVRLRSGAEQRTTRPGMMKVVNKRDRIITVHSIDCGRSEFVRYAENGDPVWRPVEDPGVCWPGSGGYWHHAKLADVELVQVRGETAR